MRVVKIKSCCCCCNKASLLIKLLCFCVINCGKVRGVEMSEKGLLVSILTFQDQLSLKHAPICSNRAAL